METFNYGIMIELFKNIATQLGYSFNYGSEDWQNLLDLQDDTAQANQAKHFLLLWKDRTKAFNGFNVLTSETFSGEFVLTERSDFGEKDYNYKYETHIAKMEAKLDNYTTLISDCEGWFIESWIETEVSNLLDTNIDGIKVKFRIRHDI